MDTTAVPTADGSAWILNGEKLWCTNGTIAELMVVMARTPPVGRAARADRSRAFIVETELAGRGGRAPAASSWALRASRTACMRFTNVRVPQENLLWGEGKGLKLALITLNTGRLTLPATCAWRRGSGACEICAPLGRRARAVGAADRPARRGGADARRHGGQHVRHGGGRRTCARCSPTRGGYDIRLEAAIAKLWNTRGAAGRSSTTRCRSAAAAATRPRDSLRARGEAPIPLERVMRDLRINLIFEGSSQIMRLFIAREALDMHLKVAGDVVMPGVPLGKRLAGLVRAAALLRLVVPARWLGWGRWPQYAGFGGSRATCGAWSAPRAGWRAGMFHAWCATGPRSSSRRPAVPLRGHRRRAVRDGGNLRARAMRCARKDPAVGARTL